MDHMFFVTLWKRKIWLGIFIFLSVMFSIVFTAFFPKTFRVKNTLRLGQFMGEPIELSEFTQQRFKQVGFLSDAFERANLDLDIPLENLPSMIKVSIENDFNKQKDIDTILFATLGPTAELAAEMNTAISNHLIAIHTKVFNEAQGIRDKEVQEWDRIIKRSELKIDDLERKMDLVNEGNEIDRMALFFQAAKLQEQRAVLVQMTQLKLKAILESHNPIQSYPTEVASVVRVPQKAYFPRLSIVLAVLLFFAGAGWLFLCWLEFNLREFFP